MQGHSYDSLSEHEPEVTALCRFNSDVCSNCVALSQYVDDAGVLSTSFTVSPCWVITEKGVVFLLVPS